MKNELTNIEKSELKQYHRKIKDGKKPYTIDRRKYGKRFIERKEKSLLMWVVDKCKGYEGKLTKEVIKFLEKIEEYYKDKRKIKLMVDIMRDLRILEMLCWDFLKMQRI
ncbi:MAG: hypothetical protein PVH88_25870 [Ignavibacteria bacterium]|jgi:hypothetical protein